MCLLAYASRVWVDSVTLFDPALKQRRAISVIGLLTPAYVASACLALIRDPVEIRRCLARHDRWMLHSKPRGFLERVSKLKDSEVVSVATYNLNTYWEAFRCETCRN